MQFRLKVISGDRIIENRPEKDKMRNFETSGILKKMVNTLCVYMYHVDINQYLVFRFGSTNILGFNVSI